MEKGESITSFCSRISQILVTGVIVDDDDLVHAIFDGLPSSWETFLSSVSGRDIQPTFERLCRDFFQEESCTATRSKPTKEHHSTLASRFDGKKRKSLSRKALRGSQTPKVCSKEKLLIHLRLNALVAISWIIFLKIVGIGIKIQGKVNSMPQLLRMMNPKENRKFL
jgi:hypothetical protein